MKFKIAKYILTICCIILLGVFLCACDSDSGELDSDPIKIAGDFEETIEVNTKFTDLGISCSDQYNVITESAVDTTTIGRYQVVYKVYSKEGELVKELSRYVHVVDTTAPTYKENKSVTYYAGYSYGIEDFITYADNYDDSENISSDFTRTTFTSPGNYLITIKLKDSSGNETTFSKVVAVILDVDKIVHDVYKTQPSKISTSSSGGGTSTYVTIDIKTAFAYWDNNNIHYLKSFNLANGNYASIQIYGQYGSLDNASINFRVTDKFNTDVYSVGFATIDATRQYTTLTISRFTSTINNIPLNEAEMLADCNSQLLNVLNEFQNYMTNTLHLEVK